MRGKQAKTEPKLVAFEDLDKPHCRWPIGDPKHGPFGFCGAGRVEFAPYCAEHQARAHVQREAPSQADATVEGASR